MNLGDVISIKNAEEHTDANAVKGKKNSYM